MNSNNDIKLIFIESQYGNSQSDELGSDYLVTIPSPIITENEHSAIGIALNTFQFVNGMYNCEAGDRWVFSCTSVAYPNGILIEIYIPEGFYTVTELINVYPNFYVFNHGQYLGPKPTEKEFYAFNRTVSTFTLTDLKAHTTTVTIPVLPSYIEVSTSLGKVGFQFDQLNITDSYLGDTSHHYQDYATTLCQFYLTGGNNNNWYKRLGVISELLTRSYGIITEGSITQTIHVASNNLSWNTTSSLCYAQYILSLLRINQIYVHLDLMGGVNISSTDNFHDSDILSVIPVSGSFGESCIYQPQHMVWHTLPTTNITNFRITLTDASGTKLDFNDLSWGMTLAYKELEYDYTKDQFPIEGQRAPIVLSHADAREMDPLYKAMDYQPSKRRR